MNRSRLAFALLVMSGPTGLLFGQEPFGYRRIDPPSFPAVNPQPATYIPDRGQSILAGWDDKSQQNGDQKKNGESKDGKNGDDEKKNGKDEKKEPKHIRDNAFLVEEAFNQEEGEVQHIFNWVNQWDRTRAGKTRDFAFAYTMELPLGSQAHQFSFTTQIPSNFEDPILGPSQRTGGIGDTFINYRYQLLANDELLWCAPRFSLILPTGDRNFGLGTGELGYQFNLPVSHYGEAFDFHFNIGTTFTPQVSGPLAAGGLSSPHDLHGYNLGASVFWKPKTNLNFFVEALLLSSEEINDLGRRNRLTQFILNPGFRCALCQLDEVEWVVGASAPIGLTKDTPDIGLFLYLSIEHGFKKKKEEE